MSSSGSFLSPLFSVGEGVISGSLPRGDMKLPLAA